MEQLNQTKIKLEPFQDHFLFSDKRFPAMVCAVGTGKTFMFLLKFKRFCERYPNCLALIVRKEATDLADSTIRDFERYFGLKVDSHRNVTFPNGSVIMFRHGAEVNVLKNMNLDIAGIEQAEEFETDETFEYIRDRMRGKNGPYQQVCVIANANGHNWVWTKWINNPTSADYDGVQATTFDNEKNLSPAFMADMRQREIDAPSHFQQYVMNNHDEVDASDILIPHKMAYAAQSLKWDFTGSCLKRVMGVDVARFGNAETVFTIIEQKNLYHWEQIFQEAYTKKDTTWTSGYVAELERHFGLDLSVIDDVGVGGGVVDNLSRNRILPFASNKQDRVNSKFLNNRDEGYSDLQTLLSKGWLKILADQILAAQLSSNRFKYVKNGPDWIKTIISKDELMKKYKVKSPDRSDTLMMAIWGKDQVVVSQNQNLPPYAVADEDINGQPRPRNMPAFAAGDGV